jgi:DNA (cytosine-5)-methyltransferase 1
MSAVRAGAGRLGLVAASTFTGCGGSDLGLEMAGFDVRWGNEFVEEARASFRANFDSPIDPRDVREVNGIDVLRGARVAEGELDLLVGSPPCGSFSMAGKREKHWKKTKKYSDTAQRSDDLFFEFARLVREARPRAFVAENVAGLVRGTAKGYFKRILAMLRECGYRVEAKLLDAQWLGVPQARVRLIFVGVRFDLETDPVFPKPLAFRYSIRDAIDGANLLADAESMSEALRPPKGDGPSFRGQALDEEWKKLRPGESSERYFQLVRPRLDMPSPTITQRAGSNAGTAGVTHPTEPRKFTIAELRRVCGFPDDFALTGTYAQQWERLGRAVPPPMMAAIASAVARDVLGHRRSAT